ncbi:MAG: hypothetical protein NT030_01005 [Candidatus Saganbacteria bacterium]|nr:hypothetical protein [Candidatus Saganbacteria bacterium]
MPTLRESFKGVSYEDSNFVGTISFKDESKALPDGSKVALGVDDGRWVLLYQKDPPKGSIVMYEYISTKKFILVDKKEGTRVDLAEMNKLISYFLDNARTEDVVTAVPQKYNPV